MHLFATREHNKMAAVGYVPAMKEIEEREREKNRKTLVENLCKAQGKAAAALEFKISWEEENRRGVQSGREVSKGVASLVLRFHLLHEYVSLCVCSLNLFTKLYYNLANTVVVAFVVDSLSVAAGSELGLSSCSSCSVS